MTGAEILAQHGIVPEPTSAASPARFPDGAHFRIAVTDDKGKPSARRDEADSRQALAVPRYLSS